MAPVSVLMGIISSLLVKTRMCATTATIVPDDLGLVHESFLTGLSRAQYSKAGRGSAKGWEGKSQVIG